MPFKPAYSLLTDVLSLSQFKCLKLLGMSLTLNTLICTSALGTLPAPISNALTTAGLSSNDISMVILPVNHEGSQSATSHLPLAILPKSHLRAKDYVDSHIASYVNIQTMTQLDAALRHSSVTDDSNVTGTTHLIANNQSNSQHKDTTTIAVTNKPIRLDDGSILYLEPVSTSTFDKRNNPTTAPNNGLNLATLQNRAYKSDLVYPNAQPLSSPIRHYASVPRTPASTMKLIPTFVALDMLGRDFIWYTKVYHTGYVINHTLHGDLIIKGSGDPKLTYNQSEQLLLQVQQAGIHHIAGDIVIDSSIFQNVSKDPSLFDNDPLRPYNASPDGMLINFNSMEITATPQYGGQVALGYTPRLADYALPATTHLRAGRCRSIGLSLAPTWGQDGLVFGKGMPRGCGTHVFYIAHPDPKEFTERVIKQQWLEMDNILDGKVISTESPNLTTFGSYSAVQDKPIPFKNRTTLLSASRLPLTGIDSYPLAQQIFDINHYSNNVMTEQVLLSIAAYHDDLSNSATMTPDAPTVSYPDALNLITDWWQHTLRTPQPYLTNGSGLCRECTVTANNLAELLQYAYSHPDFATYIYSMGTAGVDGTIATHKRRKPNSAAIGRAWIKTGTLDNVTAMAGYVKGRSQQDYVVVGIINTPHKLNATKARRVLDEMLDWTARH